MFTIFNSRADQIGNILVTVFHKLALFGIGAATTWAAGWTFWELFAKPYATISDLLLLFIYLEIGAMVGIYFNTNHMPVRFLLYIAITALTRHLVEMMSHSPVDVWHMVATAGCVFVVTLSVVVIRFGSWRFSSKNNSDDTA